MNEGSTVLNESIFSPEEVGGSVETIGEQFMNETSKRELGECES